MRRRKLIAAVVGLAVLVAVGAFVLWPRTDRITEENFDLLRVGMSKPEVYAVLGPPGLYLTRDADYGDGGDKALGQAPRAGGQKGVEKWVGDQVALWVQFDTEGHVGGAVFIPMKIHDRGPLGNFLWLIKYRFRSLFDK
jgi:hypothetical protein